ncbi:PREDICTED: transmembrane protein 254-like [Gekko japonicus]|uniref:Transmembrane protein 254 n=1 Tax=Gekko japonicus TaxID=146911 RepID=A0ABM1KZA4_GEKJA|nr:PREDICTED: transmembrane protein 254-like [Gekko japonicus]
MVSSEAAPRSAPSAYFKQTHPVFMAAVAFGLVYHGWVVFSAETFPYDFLGPIGTFTRYLAENHKIFVDIGYAIVWLIHVGEALYCLKLCRDKGITDPLTQFRWVAQTFCFGLTSFFLLLIYTPPKEEDGASGRLDRKKKEH